MSITPPTVQLLLEHGTVEQRRIAELIAERHWTCTMVMTEPDAGSDVGLARTTAEPCADGSWSIRGVKRFITFGDHDAAENIIHLVLARPKGVPEIGGPGARGLSLFVVPKYHFDTDGKIGERNGITVTGIEHKMGLYGSPTCEMDFGGGEVPATGWLLGDSHEGLPQMFHVIRHLRMMTGTKALGALSTGYLNALSFAKDRVQGSPVDNPGGEPIAIIGHPDVRRSLLAQKAYAEGLRLLVLYTAAIMDATDDASRSGLARGNLDRQALLLPIVKGYASEMAFRVLGNESLQVLGGSGYLRDYPVEQYVRDTKIDAIYEGTTGIQGLDLFRRQILRDRAETVRSFINEAVSDWVPSAECFAIEASLFQESATAIGDMVDYLVDLWDRKDVDGAAGPDIAAQGATPLLFALGDLIVGGLLLRAAGVAKSMQSKGSSDNHDFLAGKCASARWFMRQVVSRITSQRDAMRLLSSEPLRMSLSSF